MNYKNIEILKKNSFDDLDKYEKHLIKLRYILIQIVEEYNKTKQINFKILRKFLKCNDQKVIELCIECDFYTILVENLKCISCFEKNINEILKTICCLLKCSINYHTEEIFNLLFEILSSLDINNFKEEHINIVFNLICCFYILFTKKLFYLFIDSNFFTNIDKFLKIHVSIDFVIFEIIEKGIDEFDFQNHYMSFIYNSLSNVTPQTSEIVSLILYDLISINKLIINNEQYINILLRTMRFQEASRYYLLKIFRNIGDPKYFRNESIVKIINMSLSSDNSKIVSIGFDCVSQCIKLSKNCALDNFFNDGQLLSLVFDSILCERYKIKKHSLITFLYILNYLPEIISNIINDNFNFDIFVDLFSFIDNLIKNPDQQIRSMAMAFYNSYICC